MEWLLVIMALAALFFLLKFNHFKHRITLITVIFLVLFFYFSLTFISRHYDVDIKTTAGLVQVGKVYVSWFSSAFANMKTITSSVVGMNWDFKSNSTDSGSDTSDTKGIMKG